MFLIEEIEFELSKLGSRNNFEHIQNQTQNLHLTLKFITYQIPNIQLLLCGSQIQNFEVK